MAGPAGCQAPGQAAVRRRPPRLMSKSEVLRRTGLKPATLELLSRSGAFPRPIQGRWDPGEVERWLAALPTEGQEGAR